MESKVSDENDTRNKRNSKCCEGGLGNVKHEEVTINIDEDNKNDVEKQNKMQEEADDIADRNQSNMKTATDSEIVTDLRIRDESKRNLKVMGNAMDTSISEEITNVLHEQPIKDVWHRVKSASPDDRTNVDLNTKDVVIRSDIIRGSQVLLEQQNYDTDSEIYLSLLQSQDIPLITTESNESGKKDEKEKCESIITFSNESTNKTHSLDDLGSNLVTAKNFEISNLKGQKYVSYNQNIYEMESDIYSSLSFPQMEISKPELFKILEGTNEIREKISTMKISNKNKDPTQLNDVTEAVNYRGNRFSASMPDENKAVLFRESHKETGNKINSCLIEGQNSIFSKSEGLNLKDPNQISPIPTNYTNEPEIYSTPPTNVEINTTEFIKPCKKPDKPCERKADTMKLSNKNGDVCGSFSSKDLAEPVNYKENCNYFILLPATERKAASMKESNKDRDVKEKKDNINNEIHSSRLESDRFMQDNERMSNNTLSNEIHNNRLKMELISPKDLENQNSQLQSKQCTLNENVNIKDQSQTPASDIKSQLSSPSDVSTKSPRKPKPLPRKIHNVSSPIKLSNFNFDTPVGESEMLPESHNKNPVPVPKKRKITAEKLQNQNKIQEPVSKPEHGSYDKNIKSAPFSVVVKDRDNAKNTHQSRYSLGNIYKSDTRSISDLHKTEKTNDKSGFSTLRTCESLNDLTFNNKIKRHLQSSPPSSLSGMHKSTKEKKFPAANFFINKLKKHFKISVKAKNPKPSSKFYC